MEKTEQKKNVFLTQYFVSFHNLASHSVHIQYIHLNPIKKQEQTEKKI